MSQSLTERMQSEITEKLQGAFASVMEDKNRYYQENPGKIPDPVMIGSLISACAAKNAAISASASLVPGPLGMLAVIPELVLVTRNQIGLIYDIGAAHGKQEMMSKELLLGVFLSGMGTSAGSLMVLHGGKYLVRRASLQVLQKVVAILGGKITQAALKSAISKWFPGVGAAAMAAWSNYMTRQIGKKAHEILRNPIENDPATPDIQLIEPIEYTPVVAECAAPATAEPLEFYKLQVLIGLARIDGRISEEEERFLVDALDTSSLGVDHKLRLTAMLTDKVVSTEGVQEISASPEDAIALLSSMTALAKRDDQFHITEKLYIRQVGKLLGFSEGDIDEAIATA